MIYGNVDLSRNIFVVINQFEIVKEQRVLWLVKLTEKITQRRDLSAGKLNRGTNWKFIKIYSSRNKISTGK